MKIRLEKIIRHPLTYILLAALFMRLYFIFAPGIAWWDSSVYIGLGKYIFSAGTVGVEEFFRPLLLPLILGFAWKLGANPYYFGMVFDLLLNLTAIWLTYIIAKKAVNKNAAIIASALLAISSTFIFYSSKVLTENLTTVLMLLSVYLLLEKRYSCAGLIAGISVLARYPQGILLPAFLLFIMVFEKSSLKKRMVDSAKTTIFFAVPLAGLFIYNFVAFGDLFYQINRARDAMAKAGMMIPAEWYFYFGAVIAETFLAVFFIYALYLAWKEKNKSIWLINIVFIFFFAYYSTVLRKEIRYLMVVLPMLYISIGYVFESLWHKRLFRKKHIVKYILVSLIILFAVTSFFSLRSMNHRFYRPQYPEVMAGFYNESLLSGKTIISSSPNPAAYLDSKVVVMGPSDYYPYLNISADYYAIYTCDFYCKEPDCLHNKQTFLTILNNTKKPVYEKELEHCSYLLYEND